MSRVGGGGERASPHGVPTEHAKDKRAVHTDLTIDLMVDRSTSFILILNTMPYNGNTFLYRHVNCNAGCKHCS